MNKQAIVILYTGNKPSQDAILQMVEALHTIDKVVPELVEVKHFDSDSIAAAIVRESVQAHEAVDVDSSATVEALKNAVTFIAQSFVETGSGLTIALIKRLVDNVGTASIEDLEPTVALRNAVEIIATTSPTAIENLPKVYAKKMHAIWDPVKEAYNIVKNVVYVSRE